jgi:hypothetical protein
VKPGAGNIPDSGDAVNLACGFLGSKSKQSKGIVLELGAPNWRVAEICAHGFWLALAEFARKNRVAGGNV